MEKRLDTTNIVVTRIVGGKAQPIFSCEKGEKNAAARVQAAISSACMEAKRSGSPDPDFVVTEEHRKANVDGTVLLSSTSKEVDSLTLKPLKE